MPRKKRNRRIQLPPAIKGMSVSGVRGRRSNEVFLHLDEYETIRLLDYFNMTQEQAAVLMNVSRPTLTRIYEVARNKVATAFVEGRDIVFKGGKVYFDENEYTCNSCGANFKKPEGGEAVCPSCNSKDVVTLNDFYSDKK